MKLKNKIVRICQMSVVGLLFLAVAMELYFKYANVSIDTRLIFRGLVILFELINCILISITYERKK